MANHNYYVYILANKHHSVLYTGVTNDLARRVSEHRDKLLPGFTSRYNASILVYYEWFEDVNAAIGREKQIKGGSRQDKLDLIRRANPEWRDLFPELA